MAFAVLPVLAATLLLSPAPRAEAACAADYCFTFTTNENGTYVLSIPPGTLGLFYPQLADCTWDIEAQFGDGSEPWYGWEHLTDLLGMALAELR